MQILIVERPINTLENQHQYVIDVDHYTDFVSLGIDPEALGLERQATCTPDGERPLLSAQAGSRIFIIENSPTGTYRKTSVDRQN